MVLAAYVDVAQDAHAGMSNYMLSYSWGYKYDDVVSAVKNFCQLRDIDTTGMRIWICFVRIPSLAHVLMSSLQVCVNQWRVRAARQAGEYVPFEASCALRAH